MIFSPHNCDICTTPQVDIVLPDRVCGTLLYCTCPLCNQKVGADIYDEKIHCPACGAEADWKE